MTLAFLLCCWGCISTSHINFLPLLTWTQMGLILKLSCVPTFPCPAPYRLPSEYRNSQYFCFGKHSFLLLISYSITWQRMPSYCTQGFAGLRHSVWTLQTSLNLPEVNSHHIPTQSNQCFWLEYKKRTGKTCYIICYVFLVLDCSG